MKTKVLKLALPVLAVMMGVGLSFATNADSILTKAYIKGSAGEPIPVSVSCDDTSQDRCFFMGFEVFKNSELTLPLNKTQ